MAAHVLLLLLLLLGCATTQCLGPGETSAVVLVPTLLRGTVQSVRYVTAERLVVQTDDLESSIYFSLDGGLTWIQARVCSREHCRRISADTLPQPQLELDAAVRLWTIRRSSLSLCV